MMIKVAASILLRGELALTKRAETGGYQNAHGKWWVFLDASIWMVLCWYCCQRQIKEVQLLLLWLVCNRIELSSSCSERLFGFELAELTKLSVSHSSKWPSGWVE